MTFKCQVVSLNTLIKQSRSPSLHYAFLPSFRVSFRWKSENTSCNSSCSAVQEFKICFQDKETIIWLHSVFAIMQVAWSNSRYISAAGGFRIWKPQVLDFFRWDRFIVKRNTKDIKIRSFRKIKFKQAHNNCIVNWNNRAHSINKKSLTKSVFLFLDFFPPAVIRLLEINLSTPVDCIIKHSRRNRISGLMMGFLRTKLDELVIRRATCAQLVISLEE